MKSLKKIVTKYFFAFLIFLIAVLFNQYSGNRGVFPIDSFSHFDTGYRIILGDRPFEDYWIVSGFFVDYLQSLIFILLGVNWQTFLLHASILNGVVTLVIYYLFLSIGLNRALSFFYSVCFSILAYPSSGTPFVDHHSAFLSLLAIFVFIRAINENKNYYWILIPIIFAAAFLSKQVPASYMFITTILILVYHMKVSEKKNNYKILFYLSFSSLAVIFLTYSLFFLNSISLQNFFDQYINFPKSLGKQRLVEVDLNYKNLILDFKFIYIIILMYMFLISKNLFLKKKYYKHINFKIFLINILLSFSLIYHLLMTKNQNFIFFLIPLLAGFAQIEIDSQKKNIKKYFTLISIFLCLTLTYKYHYRFNVDRKFHELSSINFSESIDAVNLDKKFKGLRWITPKTVSKEQNYENIKYLTNVKNIIVKDKSKKIILTNYSIFSVLTGETSNNFSRWFPYNESAVPGKNNKYSEKYISLVYSLILRKKIDKIYILNDIKENSLTDYIDQSCLNKRSVKSEIIIYNINRNVCSEIYLSGKLK